MLDSNDIRSIIVEVVKGVDISGMTDDQDFDDAGIDSLDHSMILLSIEEKTSVKIPDEAVEDCRSVQGIIAFLRENPA